MSPYQHLFSTNAVLNVWRNLRSNHRPGEPNDLLLTLQYQPDEGRTRKFTKGNGVASGKEVEGDNGGAGANGVGVGTGGRSIGFVVPWRSMQAQKRELREKEKELAEALVVLAGEVAFTDLPPTLQTSLATSPLLQTRHICAGLSRQISKIELQMADNAAFARGKNLYTGGEIARKFLPPIEQLFELHPVPQRMVFELLMELKDLVYAGMAGCDEETGEWEAEGYRTLEEVDGLLVRSLVALPVGGGEEIETRPRLQPQAQIETGPRKVLKRKPSALLQQQSPPPSQTLQQQQQQQPPPWPSTTPTSDLLYALESLETTSAAMSHLTPPIPDFLAASSLTLRRMLDRRVLNDFALAKKKRAGRCAEYARCMKWAGGNWRQGGGCRRGCANEDEDPEALPSWHSSSRWFEGDGEGMGRRRVGRETLL
ncbi:hypothetical protein K505DRAFT_372570 [Melanomma pulvis-pyrius CBS 109.77]|uniref:Uncharacterized protein n=1 Tax=Melanomma pulvis-pyrius CBS 109.77 TaxID=1314802 RepID=A0A6A6XL26_9PLEO|nr:hypothetical protein K505DRAFT_372570 [Melanomma pulvis-pyrius CBS 109.77]